jgi:hypothetical protein
MNAPTETEIAATLFLHDPCILSLGVLCETGDFGYGSWLFHRARILRLAHAVYKLPGLSVSVGRNLKRTRTYRRVYDAQGRDITDIHDPRDRRHVTEEIRTAIVTLPGFAIQIKGPRFEYVFGATFEPRGEGVDLEALYLKIKGP